MQIPHNQNLAATPLAEIIGFDSGWGCRNFGCEDGPHKLSPSTIIHRLTKAGVAVKWRGPLGLKFLGDHAAATTKEDTLEFTVTALRRLFDTVREATLARHVPVVIGGDHSSAIGTWSGVVNALQAEGNFGLIWLDAHLDAHTAETSHEGKWGGWWHGQPVTALTGWGLNTFRTLGGNAAKISPQHLSIIGPHSFEPSEAAFVAKHGIRVYFLEEVRKRGFAAVFQEAYARATRGTAGFGLSIDLDAFQPGDAPGVGTTEDEGLVAGEVLPVLKSLARQPAFRGLEIAEFNPHNDRDQKTLHLLETLLETLFKE